MCVMRIYKIYSFGNLQVYNAALITVVTRLYNRIPELIHHITRILSLLTNISLSFERYSVKERNLNAWEGCALEGNVAEVFHSALVGLSPRWNLQSTDKNGERAEKEEGWVHVKCKSDYCVLEEQNYLSTSQAW